MSFESDKSERSVVVVLVAVGGGVFFFATVIATLYHYMVNGVWWGGWVSFLATTFLVIASAVTLIIACLLQRVEYDGWRRWKGFLCLLVYFLSPILLGWVSLLLKWTGNVELGRQVFYFRYWALLKGPVIGLLYLAVVAVRKRIRQGQSSSITEASGCLGARK
jgi:hypothetical protein